MHAFIHLAFEFVRVILCLHLRIVHISSEIIIYTNLNLFHVSNDSQNLDSFGHLMDNYVSSSKKKRYDHDISWNHLHAVNNTVKYLQQQFVENDESRLIIFPMQVLF